MRKQTTLLVSMFLIVVGVAGCTRNLQTRMPSMADGQPQCSMGEPMVQPAYKPNAQASVYPGGSNSRWTSAGSENTTARPPTTWQGDAPF